MDNDSLSFVGDDPGAVRHGNFINYYKFHPASIRINNLPSDKWHTSDTNCATLDVGCNSGELTIELHKFLINTSKWKNVHTLGIDIDNNLIDRAKEIAINNVSFDCMNVASENDFEKFKMHLKDMKKERFDIVFCFSVTLWIHLNNGDNGLKHFLEKICSICDTLVIEPQPWKCYRSAVRRMKKSSEIFPLYAELKIKHNVVDEIEKIVVENGRFSKIFESFPDKENWNRKIMIFRRNNVKS